MPRPRFLSRGATWKPTDILPEGPKSRRRRLLNHITRFASSPSLSRSSEEVGSRKQAVSCVSLEGVGIGDSYGLGADTQSSLELFVDCEDGKEEISTGLRWDALPNEVKMGVLQWFKPKELVRVSVVSALWEFVARGAGTD